MMYSFCYPSIKTCAACPMFKPYKQYNGAIGICRHSNIKGIRHDNVACIYAVKRFYDRIAY